MNYYKLFDLPEKIFFDKKIITQKYLELQKKYHPDFFTNENEAEKENTLQFSAATNIAYKIFANKEKSIEYFLLQKGVIIANEKYQLPASFLMEMMDINEELEENNLKTKKIDDFEKSILADVEHVINIENTASLTDIDLQNLKLYYYKKKYLSRILDRLED
ncbi:MAG: hypothetical protein HOO89_02385 [Ferruginibacter sp.]|nr:hypothetical protein [Ferruginibacter sp.]